MASVVLITLAALVGVGVLAFQANGSGARAAKSSADHPSQTVSLSPSAGTQVPVTVDPLVLPANSGTGQRIVYSLAGKRIWLVDTDGKTVKRTAPVQPGTVNPTPSDKYKVSLRRNSSRGQDGTSVQYLVVFGEAADGTSLGFDAVAGVAGMPPAPTKATGGIRLTQEDALAVWTFTASGTKAVVVVP